ncbi:MAG TPA: PspA/IM30 family protein [Vicinamibacteria bacterium]|nr:PspA/IM30 family protein [Vicinamibacteria bacterium]
MSAAVSGLDPFVHETEGAVVELRREAVNAVARQQRLRQEIATIRAQAHEIEREASRALARGEEILARQILARGMCTLTTRDALEAELTEARGHVARLLTTMVRTENRAWGTRGPRRG